ncbi:hypothetical protein GWI33_015260 [Rhynchophorus ferrugineus]|uniref:Neuropeptide-like 4 n=1 Tax=Rhynchophorus ferrugineus TaxID=354439 RepID=A0A834MBL5_RHYFE|nr:hypothetical protein GWI33_015260 [Rhynchophorus ferrugineus]
MCHFIRAMFLFVIVALSLATVLGAPAADPAAAPHPKPQWLTYSASPYAYSAYPYYYNSYYYSAPAYGYYVVG